MKTKTKRSARIDSHMRSLAASDVCGSDFLFIFISEKALRQRENKIMLIWRDAMRACSGYGTYVAFSRPIPFPLDYDTIAI